MRTLMLAAFTGFIVIWAPAGAFRQYDVSLSPDLPADQREAYIRAMDLWEAAVPTLRLHLLHGRCTPALAMNRLICAEPGRIADLTNVMGRESVGLYEPFDDYDRVRVAIDQEPADYTQVAAHELGHAMGIPDDTDHPGCVMFWRLVSGIKGPTRDDVRAWYRVIRD